MATLRRKTAAAARELPADAPAGAAADADPHARAEALIHALRSAPTAKIQGQARALLLALRERRAFDLLLRLAEALCRIDPADPLTRRLYAQALIEAGALTAAIDMLRQLLATLAAQHAEAAEASGLLGRACKQIFFESGASGSAGARWALAAAIEAYAGPYRAQPERHTWHGVNLLALVSRARIEGWPDIAPEVEPLTLAVQLSARLRTLPPKARDVWYLPTLAEATLGLSLATGDLKPVEDLLAEYIGSPDVQAFQVASTLRQFTEVWGLEALTPRTRGIGLKGAAAVARARRLTDVLRARLLQLPGGALTIPAATAAALPPRITGDAAGPDATGMAAARARLKRADPAERGQLEAILGAEGPQTLAWWRAGIEAARSVAVVRQRLGKRLGTGFLVRAGDLGLTPADESLLLTNFHVVNADGVAPGIRPDDAEVVFEAADASQAYGVASLVWSSPIDRHDASLLRLKRVPEGIAPLVISTTLPPRPAAGAKKRPRVYIIGYPGGRELSFSFQDNELLDHEGPPAGQPQIPGVCRVHYVAPTEGGNSGSPVFDDSGWRVIALHHKGGKFGMPKLNGASGTYAANEGLALSTIADAVRSALR